MFKNALIISVLLLGTQARAGVDHGNPSQYKNTEFQYGIAYDADQFKVDESDPTFVKVIDTSSVVALSIKTFKTSIQDTAEIGKITNVAGCISGKLNGAKGFVCQNRYVLLAPGKAIFELNYMPETLVKDIVASFTIFTFTNADVQARYSPDGRYLVAGFKDTYRIYDAFNFKLVASRDGSSHNPYLTAPNFSPDGKNLIFSDGPELFFMDIATAQIDKKLTLKSNIHDYFVTADQGWIVVNSCAPEVYSYQTGDWERTFSAPANICLNRVMDIQDDTVLIAANYWSSPGIHGHIFYADVRSGKILQEIQVAQYSDINQAVFANNEKWVAEAGDDEFKVFDLKTARPILEKTVLGRIRKLLFAGVDDNLASYGEKEFRLISVNTGKVLVQIKGEGTYGFRDMTVNRDHSQVSVIDDAGNGYVLDANTGQVTHRFHVPRGHVNYYVEFTPDGKGLVLTFSGLMMFFDL